MQYVTSAAWNPLAARSYGVSMVTSPIRPAVADDAPEILELIQALAGYENEADSVKVTEDRLREQLFGENPAVFAFVAEAEGGTGRRIDGVAIWFLNFSTWEGEHGIYLEDLFVRPERRGSGLGKQLLRTLAATALDRGYRRVEWSVLTWNEPSIQFYESLGAEPMDGWQTYRLDGRALRDFGAA